MIQLAGSPMPHVTRAALSVLDQFRIKSNATDMHRPIPAPDPSPEPNPEPDGALKAQPACIAPDDWDELYHAIQSRLEDCVEGAFNKSLVRPLHERQAATKAAVLECVASMTHLHTSLKRERQARKYR